ncbi:hypothetical protein BGX21_008035 [Mortierella sp. AD011]|nr:hypothetical protein BGX20_008056 [Mortierella sp. AD010]KAF9398237.1 hypothetical protein BGX21_008035 [Mortierella sp. AD011]
MSSPRRVAIVTGSSRGIGRGIALRLARDGFHVVVNYQSNAVKAQEVVDQIAVISRENAVANASAENTIEPVRAIAIKADVGHLDQGRELLDATIKEFNRLDVVVLNAAWLFYQSIHDMTEDSYTEAFNTNVKGPMFFAKIAQPYLLKAQEGKEGAPSVGGSRIITISTSLTSLSSIQGEHFVYTATKGALEQMTRVLAKDKEFGGKGITVNSIAPGPIDTEGFNRGLSEAHVAMIKSFHPQNRLGEPDDVASAVSFLAREDSRWVNGQTIRVNGGLGV